MRVLSGAGAGGEPGSSWAAGGRHPRTLGSLESLRLFSRGSPEVFRRAAERHGPVVALNFFGKRAFLLNDAEHVRHVLTENHRNYPKSPRYEPIKLVAGEGLLTASGDLWRRHRDLLQPAFHREQVAALASVMTREAEALAHAWEEEEQTTRARHPTVDVFSEMNRLTLRIVAKALFGAEVEAEAATLGEAMGFLNRYVGGRAGGPMSLPVSLPTPKNRRFRRALAEVETVVYRMIDRRANTGSPSAEDPPAADGHLLSMLLSARDEDTAEGLTRAQLRDEVVTLLFAGSETTATALSWTWYLLSKNPAAERLLYEELDRTLSGRDPCSDDLPYLGYTEAVFREAMRLYPPAHILGRVALEDDEIGGVGIPAGSEVALLTYVTHRNPLYWHHPERFRPERFLDGPENNRRPPFSYYPFGGGQRICIGKRFALTEGVLALATLARRYRLRLLPGQRVEPLPAVTLRPKGKILMALERRQT